MNTRPIPKEEFLDIKRRNRNAEYDWVYNQLKNMPPTKVLELEEKDKHKKSLLIQAVRGRYEREGLRLFQSTIKGTTYLWLE